ncbi:MAG: MqnA/MqnD/SBP family protein [Candidatus Aenigmatarchaeota archaeon]
MMSKKYIIIAVLIIAIIAIFSIYALNSTSSKKEEKVKLVFMNNAWSYGFKWSVDNGLVELPKNVEINLVPSERWNDMFINGEADMGMVTLPVFTIAWNKNNDWRILYPHGRTYSIIFAREDSNITSIKDLKGKTVAIGGLTWLSTLFLQDLFVKNNMSLNDVTLIAKPLPVIPQLIQKGDVDAGMLSVENVPDVERLKLKKIVDMDEECIKLYGTYLMPSVIAAKKGIDENTIKAVAGSLDKALAITYNNSDKVVGAYYEEYGLNITDKMNAYKSSEFRIYVPWNENRKDVMKYEFGLCKNYNISENVPQLEDVILEIA